MLTVTKFEITQLSDGQKRTVSRASLQKKLKPKDFEKVAHECGTWGTWENDQFKIRSVETTVPGVTHMFG